MRNSSLFPLAAASLLIAACEQQDTVSDQNQAQEPALNLPAVPRPQPPVDRAALLAAVAEAASAVSIGADMPESVRELDGRKFEIRIRFGCRGPAADLSERWLGWSFDADNRRIRVRAMPTISSDDPLVERVGTEEFEAVEGFWIPRPWVLQSLCPAAAGVAAPSAEQPLKPVDGKQASTTPASRASVEPRPPRTAPTEAGEEDAGEPLPTAPRVGIAQFFTREDPRTRRRGARPYQSAYTLKEGQALSSQGYNLVLSGRLRAIPGRGVIHCVTHGPDLPPECIVSALFQRVWIEQPDTRDVIAEWGTG